MCSYAVFEGGNTIIGNNACLQSHYFNWISHREGGNIIIFLISQVFYLIVNMTTEQGDPSMTSVNNVRNSCHGSMCCSQAGFNVFLRCM